MEDLTVNEIVYSGKAKYLYDSGEYFTMEFTDNITAFNGEKKDILPGKGKINNTINAWFMRFFKSSGILNHLIKVTSDNKSLVRKLKIIPLECIVRNYAFGSICKRLSIKEREKFKLPIYQLCLKDDDLGDPVVSEYEALSIGWATEDQIKEIRELSLRINNLLLPIFAKAGFILADFKLEFGIDEEGKVYLADEFTPDGCRVWDADTGEIYDKDRFRRDLGDVIPYYHKIADRLGITSSGI